jgi:hypothetical protein
MDQARNVAQGTPKGRKFGKKTSGVDVMQQRHNRDPTQQLRLGSKENVNETFRETLGVEIKKKNTQVFREDYYVLKSIQM